MSEISEKEQKRLEVAKKQELFLEKLRDAFPIFWRKNVPPPYAFPSVGLGWHEIIWNCSKAFEEELNAVKHLLPVELLPYTADIKEKFGGLRFYFNIPETLPEEVESKLYDLAQVAENKSVTTCEVCGQPGKIRSKTPSGKTRWMKTLCTDCWLLDKSWF